MEHCDVVIVGSGFGGSVSALRLAEKGYSVKVLEKGPTLQPQDFATSCWQVRKMLWAPWLGCRGPLKFTVFQHVTVFSGVGVGGGSLVYAATHPVPGDAFFQTGQWANLGPDWKQELTPHYYTALKMIGATKNPKIWPSDRVIESIAIEDGCQSSFEIPKVAINFSEEGKMSPDPFFGGEGPERFGCIHCGGCMIGCQYGAKNSMDFNYLYFAQKKGAVVLPNVEVTAVRPFENGTYIVEGNGLSTPIVAKRVVFSGGVLGTCDLLLKMKNDPHGLPLLSPATGSNVRTNSESLIKIVVPGNELGDLSKGIAISSKYKIDDVSAVEPVRGPPGSGFYRFWVLPHCPGNWFITRFARMMWRMCLQPMRHLRLLFIQDWARHYQILLFMRTSEGTLTLQRNRLFGLYSSLVGPAPQLFIADATRFAERFAAKAKGVLTSLFTELILGTPSTAHILGGACIHTDPKLGVIDLDQQVHGYPGLYVCDGSAVSANVGVNPSLTIMAMTERAMQKIPKKTA